MPLYFKPQTYRTTGAKTAISEGQEERWRAVFCYEDGTSLRLVCGIYLMNCL